MEGSFYRLEYAGRAAEAEGEAAPGGDHLFRMVISGASHELYGGHFPVRPVLAGAVSVDAVHAALSHLGYREPSQIRMAKWLRPVYPTDGSFELEMRVRIGVDRCGEFYRCWLCDGAGDRVFEIRGSWL